VITDGTSVVLLNTWTERGGGGIFTWLVLAREVHTEQFPDKATAIRAIADWAGESQRWVSGHPYSLERPDNFGTVIYWQAEPVRRRDALRPAGLTVRPNGWLVTDEASLLVKSVDVTAGGHGTGVRRQPARSR
jgi:hypothetical protein